MSRRSTIMSYCTMHLNLQWPGKLRSHWSASYMLAIGSQSGRVNISTLYTHASLRFGLLYCLLFPNFCLFWENASLPNSDQYIPMGNHIQARASASSHSKLRVTMEAVREYQILFLGARIFFRDPGNEREGRNSSAAWASAQTNQFVD